MNRMKSVLALLMAVCLMVCLAVPAFATEVETTAATQDTTETVEATTEPAEETKGTEAVEDTTGAAADTTGAVTEHDHDHDHDTEAEPETEEPESGFVKVLRVVLTVLEVIASLILVVVVLAQSGKEAGLSGAISGNSESYLNKSGLGGLDKKLAGATKWVALAWIVLTLALSLLP